MTALPHDGRMTVSEFLAWPGGDDTRYELIEGHPVAQAAPSEEHSTLQMALGIQLGQALAGRRPCRILSEVGIRSAFRQDWNYRQADLVVTCAPRIFGQKSPPQVVIEILSEGNERETRDKLFYYAAIASVREIVMIDSRRPVAEVYRRDPSGEWIAEPAVSGAGETLALASLDVALDMDTLYRDVLPPEDR